MGQGKVREFMHWQGVATGDARVGLAFPFWRGSGLHGLIVGGLFVGALVLHLVLIALGWPLTNSDEGTMGIMALHIAYQGAHPTFFYGQNYMGSWEAWLGAAIFRLLGPSLFALRLGTTVMFALFLAILYWLTRLLFTKTWALVTLLLVGTGSGFMLTQEVRAIGGYAETLCFCTLLCLCAVWLVLTYRPGQKRQIVRWLVYLLWGLTAGLGLWNDLLIVPPILATGLLLLFICWRELRRPMPLLFVVVGLCIGAFPTIYYNLHAAPGQDSLSVLRGLHGDGGQIYAPVAVWHEISNTFQVSLPLMTGEPFCPVTEIPFLGPTSQPTLACNLARGTWSAGYLILFGLACLIAWRSTRLLWHKRRERSADDEGNYTLRVQLARLAVLLSAALTLAIYTFSNAPLSGPGLHARYLICLLSATPAVYWPLWVGLCETPTWANSKPRLIKGAALVGLLGLGALSLLGSVLAFSEVPAVAASNQRDAVLISTLEHLGVRHIYTDYWTCDKIAFESDEHIVCAVLNASMHPDAHNRYAPYYAQVWADRASSYIFPLDSLQYQPDPAYAFLTSSQLPRVDWPARFRTGYTRVVTDGYVMYIFATQAVVK